MQFLFGTRSDFCLHGHVQFNVEPKGRNVVLHVAYNCRNRVVPVWCCVATEGRICMFCNLRRTCSTERRCITFAQRLVRDFFLSCVGSKRQRTTVWYVPDVSFGITRRGKALWSYLMWRFENGLSFLHEHLERVCATLNLHVNEILRTYSTHPSSGRVCVLYGSRRFLNATSLVLEL